MLNTTSADAAGINFDDVCGPVVGGLWQQLTTSSAPPENEALQDLHRRALADFRRLEDLGRARLSPNFFMREFLHSEIGSAFGIPNIPDDFDHCVKVGKRLCQELLEPLNEEFGRIVIRSGYRSRTLNAFGNAHRLGCAGNEANYAGHIWDATDAEGRIGATATIVVPSLTDHVDSGGDWRDMAWWIHDHLPYCTLVFYPRLIAFNIRWSSRPKKLIRSFIQPKGLLAMRPEDGSN